MVVVLHNQIRHLVVRVPAAVFHVLCDIGNFRPDDQTVLIAQVVETLCVLIVGQTNGVGAHLPQQGQILLVFGVGQGAAQALAILMPGCTAQTAGSAVEEKALPRVKGDGAAAKAGANRIPARQ